jgi:hypothetical protein
MVPELPSEIRHMIMHIRRTDDAITIQRYWRGYRWRMWLDSETMPFVSSWHPQSKFLDASQFDEMTSDGHAGDDDEEDVRDVAISCELEDCKINKYRSLARMAAQHFGEECVPYQALFDQVDEQALNHEFLVLDKDRLRASLLAFHGVALSVIEAVMGDTADDDFVRAIAKLKAAPVSVHRTGTKRLRSA